MTAGADDAASDVDLARSGAFMVACFALSLAGVYWDDAWHTDRGRDTLLSPPHVLLYAGVAGAVLVALWWALRSGGRVGDLLPCRRNGALGVGVFGALVTLWSAPVDEWWHVAFGRDAVLWSPPHLLAVAGTITLGTGAALVLGSRHGARTSPVLLTAAGAAILGGWQVLVMEYDTDVAQFAEVLYLPVLAGSLAAGAATVQAAVGTERRWPAAWSGLVQLLAMGVLVLGLRSSGFSTPIVPVSLAAFAAADATRRHNWNALSRGVAFTVTLIASYAPYLRFVPGGAQLNTGDLVIGVVVGSLVSTAAILVFDPTAHLPRMRTAGGVITVFLAVLAATLATTESARAHDPGQGIDVAPVKLRATPTLRGVAVEAVLSDEARAFVPRQLVARRAGRLRTGRLVDTGSSWTGAINLDDPGRWFLYVEAVRDGEVVEAWLPAINERLGRTATKSTWFYIPAGRSTSTVGQIAAGTVLVLTTGIVFASIAIAVRRRVAQQP